MTDAYPPSVCATDTWWVKHVCRPLAEPLVWLLLPTRVTANQVTWAWLLVSWLGCGLLPWHPLLGVLLLHAGYVLDSVDGQIARVRGTDSPTGTYFDLMVHALIRPALFMGVAVGLWLQTGQIWWVLVGTLASVSALLDRLTGLLP